MMLRVCILLASVCFSANGYYFDAQDRRSNGYWADLMDAYENSKRSYDWNNYDKRSVNNAAYQESFQDSSRTLNKREKIAKFIDDLVQLANEKKSLQKDKSIGHSKSLDSDFNFLNNQQFHENIGADIDNIEPNQVEVPVVSTHNLRMPGVVPKERDTYLCYAYELPEDDRYITKFEPVADMKTAHHMLLFSCETPYKKDKPWQCREMQPVCGSGSQSIKYAWGKNAPALEMPKNVAFHVGGNSSTKYLVVQIHYLNVEKFKDGKTKDRSGLTFTMTTQRPKFFAGIYLLAAGWPPIPPHKERFHMDMGCNYEWNVKFYPFRFRVHAHKLGAVITGYRVRNGNWTLIGRGDPQRPQAFNKVFSDVSIEDGDKVIGRCTFNSTSRNKTTYIGATHSDEMCNFYIMYFYDAEEYGNTDHLPCGEVATKKLKYPKDSDVTLAEVEKKNSLLIHNSTSSLKYNQVPNWPKGGKTDGDVATGDNVPKIGQIAGIDFIDDGKHLIMFHRGSRQWGMNTFDIHNNLNEKLQEFPIPENTLIWLNKTTGDVIKSTGGNQFYLPHGVSVDHENNIWLTDVGLHQVMKLSNDGRKVLMTLGEKFVNGNDDKHFCKPTDVAVATNGDFYVSDGYCNSRIVKFNAEGKVLLQMETNMQIVHGVSLDEKGNKLYVADRENKRVLVFNPKTGKLLEKIADTFKGPVYAVAYNPTNDGILHVLTGINYQSPGSLSGYTYSLKSKKIVSEWKPKEGFHNTHDLAVSKDNKILIATEIGPNKIWKFEQVDEKQ